MLLTEMNNEQIKARVDEISQEEAEEFVPVDVSEEETNALWCGFVHAVKRFDWEHKGEYEDN